MKYPGLFSRYPERKGKAWIKAIDPEDRKVFASIGLQESDYGKKKNAHYGAIATNILKQWRKQVRDYHYENSNLLEEML